MHVLKKREHDKNQRYKTQDVDNGVRLMWTMSLGPVSRWCWLLHSVLEMVKIYMDYVFCHTRTCALYMSGKVSPRDVPLTGILTQEGFLSA